MIERFQTNELKRQRKIRIGTVILIKPTEYIKEFAPEMGRIKVVIGMG